MDLSRILTPFRRLRWKLTFSYTLATVIAVLALEVAGLFSLFLLFSSPTVQIELVQEAAASLAEQVQSPLSFTPPDRAGLELQLRQMAPPLAGGRSVPDINIDADMQTGGRQTSFTLGEADRAAILDPSGEVLVTSGALSSAGEPGERFADLYEPVESGQIIARALGGVPAATSLPDRTILVAQPVLDDDGLVLGVVYLRVVSFSHLARNLLGGALGLIGGSTLILTIGAGIVGTLFGILVAHGFARRLGALADATEAWGRGDFSVTVYDASPDEIGQLSHRLNLMAEEIQTLLQARQELAALEERNRLARDLHDSVKQQVFATRMTLGAVESLWERDLEAAREKVAQAQAQCRQTQQELSSLIYELRPVALEDKGLAAALGETVEEWSQQTGIEASITAEIYRVLPVEVEQALFRVTQEALANAARHSRSGHVQVALSHSENTVILQVGDDGQGFDPSSVASQGMGLRSMHERLKALGGELLVESEPGKGTCITARCEFEPETEGGTSA